LGRVKAPDAETAIKKVIKDFEITDPEQQKAARRKAHRVAMSPLRVALANPRARLADLLNLTSF
jgi:hypothetical protein